MRKRIAAVSENSHQIRKRKRVYNNEKKPQQSQKSSSDTSSSEEQSDSIECSSPERKVKNNSSFFEDDGSPKPEYILSRDLVHGTILTDIAQKRWRIGKPIGKVI